MRKRKKNFKRYKTENTNRNVVLWDGRPSPFTIGTPPYIDDEYPDDIKKKARTNYLPEIEVPKTRNVSPAEWLKMVKKNERKNRKNKKPKSDA